MKRPVALVVVTLVSFALVCLSFAEGGKPGFEKSSSSSRKSYAISRTHTSSKSHSGDASYSTSIFSQSGVSSSKQSSGASVAKGNVNPYTGKKETKNP